MLPSLPALEAFLPSSLPVVPSVLSSPFRWERNVLADDGVPQRSPREHHHVSTSAPDVWPFAESNLTQLLDREGLAVPSSYCSLPQSNAGSLLLSVSSSPFLTCLLAPGLKLAPHPSCY